MKFLGIILIVLGVLGLVHGGFTYTKSRDKVDLGVLDVTVEQKKHVPISPLLGVLSLGGGVLLIMTSRRASGGGHRT